MTKLRFTCNWITWLVAFDFALMTSTAGAGILGLSADAAKLSQASSALDKSQKYFVTFIQCHSTHVRSSCRGQLVDALVSIRRFDCLLCLVPMVSKWLSCTSSWARHGLAVNSAFEGLPAKLKACIVRSFNKAHTEACRCEESAREVCVVLEKCDRSFSKEETSDCQIVSFLSSRRPNLGILTVVHAPTAKVSLDIGLALTLRIASRNVRGSSSAVLDILAAHAFPLRSLAGLVDEFLYQRPHRWHEGQEEGTDRQGPMQANSCEPVAGAHELSECEVRAISFGLAARSRLEKTPRTLYLGGVRDACWGCGRRSQIRD